ncbi:hypothetical protein M0R45_024164 [Rubus argutus]|uniref:Uncharacterized protein n=1 Tax=Rubus argutus TaxID=59490 RepID=A0AAW1WRV4_RUBAR
MSGSSFGGNNTFIGVNNCFQDDIFSNFGQVFKVWVAKVTAAASLELAAAVTSAGTPSAAVAASKAIAKAAVAL